MTAVAPFDAMSEAFHEIFPSVPNPQTVEQVAQYLYEPGVAPRLWTFAEIAKLCDDTNDVFGPSRSSSHRKIAHGLDTIVLQIREVLVLAAESGRATQVMTAQALHGDIEAIETFTKLALDGDTFALKVVALLGKLLALAAQVEVLVTELSELTAKLSEPHFDDVATFLANELLHGSMDRNAPPIRAMRERGEQSNSRRSERFCMK